MVRLPSHLYHCSSPAGRRHVWWVFPSSFPPGLCPFLWLSPWSSPHFQPGISPLFFHHDSSIINFPSSPVLSSAMFNLWYIANLVLHVLLFSYKIPLIYIDFISLNDTNFSTICQHYFSITLSNNYNIWFLGVVWFSHMSFGFVLCLFLIIELRNLSVLCMTILYCELSAMPFSLELTWTCF